MYVCMGFIQTYREAADRLTAKERIEVTDDCERAHGCLHSRSRKEIPGTDFLTLGQAVCGASRHTCCWRWIESGTTQQGA